MIPTVFEKQVACSDLGYEFAGFVNTRLSDISVSDDHYSLELIIDNLKCLGYVESNLRVRRKVLASKLYRLATELGYQNIGLFPKSEKDYRYITYMLSGNASQHPFKFLLMEFFIKKCRDERYVILKPETKIKKHPVALEIESYCIQLLEEGQSLAFISRKTGKSRCYLKGLAMRQGITINLKPRYIDSETVRQAINMAYIGFHRNAIAQRLLISSGSVEQIISSEAGLVEERRRYKYESNRRKYKVQILRAMQEKPAAIKQEIKKTCYRAFHWLYANERKWLNGALPKPRKPKVKPRVDWDQRDSELAETTRAVLEKYQGRISRSRLDNLLGGHGWLTKAKDKLPKTMEVFYSMSANRR